MNELPVLTRHASERANARHITADAIVAALDWGREYWSHGAVVCRLDRRSVRRAARAGCRLEAYEGVTVVLLPRGPVVTAWRARRPARIWR